MTHGAKAWLSSPKHPNFVAAAKATEIVHGVAPDMTREGGSIPITSALEDSTGMNVLLLPVGACDDMAHRQVHRTVAAFFIAAKQNSTKCLTFLLRSQNEKYNISNLMNGIKVRTSLMNMRQAKEYLVSHRRMRIPTML